MNKKQIILMAVIAVIIVGVTLYFKFNPLFATFETIIGFIIGNCCGWNAKKFYIKYMKEENGSKG